MNTLAQEGYIVLFLSVLHVAVRATTNHTEDAVTNVARHKETLQSHLTKYDSSLVVDGNIDQYVANGSCINIEKKGDSWWQVDLGDIYTIFHARVFLAKDCCDIVVGNEDCYVYKKTWRYLGKTSTTDSGRTCQRWDSQYPHKIYHMYQSSSAENYCRGYHRSILHDDGFWRWSFPDKPWCYTTDPNVTWEYCDIDQCETVATNDLDLKTGTRVKSLEILDYTVITDHQRHIWEFVLPSNTRARYVEFRQDGTADYYPLCEVQVYGAQDDITNVALRKTAQMSTLSPENPLDSSLAIDGILDQSMRKKSCFHSAEEDNPWWRVDLAGIYVIFLVRLYNRIDCCSDRAHDIHLQLGVSLDTMFDAGLVEGRIDNIQNIIFPVKTEARFVELIRKGWGAFHLCEVEVFGKIAECKYDPCQNGGNCSVIHCGDLVNCRSYSCACVNGFGGIDCEVCTYNVAVGKQIEVSSIYHKSWLPRNAIDGDTNQNVMFGATCVSTQKETKPYLRLDLGDEYNITGVNVYRRLDVFAEEKYGVELFLMMSTWTSYGITGGLIENVSKFKIYPYVSTRHVKLMATEEQPTFLQLCEIEVFSVCQEDLTVTTTSRPTLVTQPMPFIQMRFSLSDEYNDVVKSKDSFINLIRQGLSNQTGYSLESFRNIQLEKDPFRVSFELHATDGNRATLNEMLKKIDTLNRFGILEIEDEDGQLFAITAGSLQYHMLFVGNKGSREVMTAKRKELKHEGLGRKPNRAKPIVDDEEEILWSSGQLGAHNPVSLQNAIWWRNNFFGIRGRQEHRDMRWGDVLIQTDADGQQYLEYLERDTKTRKDPRQERPFNTRIYAIPEAPERCPVNLLIAFTHKRPLTMLQPDSPFYLSVLPQKQMKPDIWYKDCALGVHSLGDIMKNMSEKAGLKKHTNHSGRKTTVKRLREAGIESSDIIQLTGHKTIQSVNNYSDVSVKKQKQMSKILVTGAAISPDRRLVSRPVSRPPVEPTTMRSTTVPVATVTTAASPAANSLENTDLYDFDPNDNFEEIVAEIEKFESNTTQKLNTCIQKSLIPQGSFNNCTFNFSVNFAK